MSKEMYFILGENGEVNTVELEVVREQLDRRVLRTGQKSEASSRKFLDMNGVEMIPVPRENPTHFKPRSVEAGQEAVSFRVLTDDEMAQFLRDHGK